MRDNAIAKVPTRTVPVYSRSRKRVEPMTTSAHLRLKLMFSALEAGLALPPGTEIWAALSPLKEVERVGVRQEVARLFGMPEAERSAELLLLKREGNLP
jgi:hypothetical protein